MGRLSAKLEQVAGILDNNPLLNREQGKRCVELARFDRCKPLVERL